MSCHWQEEFSISRNFEEMNNIGSFQKEVFKSQHILWHFSLLPLQYVNPTDFLGECTGCHGKKYTNWLPLVDVLSSSLPHWGFRIEHLTFCFSKNMFPASLLPQQKMEDIWNVLYVIQIFHPSWGQTCKVLLLFGIFFPQKVLMETQLEIFNCVKWIWEICKEWKYVGTPLIWGDLSPGEG